MLNRFLPLHIEAEGVLLEQGLRKLVLTEDDYRSLQSLVKFLKIFKDSTVRLSAEGVSPSVVISIVGGIRSAISRAPTTGTAEWVAFLARCSKEAERLAEYEERDDLQMATLLDPRYKDGYFRDGIGESVRKRVVKELKKLPMTDAVQPPSDTADDIIPPPISKRAREAQRSPADCELTEYLSRPMASRSVVPLKWWMDNGAAFPCLAEVAQKYLTARPPCHARGCFHERSTRSTAGAGA
jgi:hypothetical protein